MKKQISFIVLIIAMLLTISSSAFGETDWQFPLPTSNGEVYSVSGLNRYPRGGAHNSYINHYVLGIGDEPNDIVIDIPADAWTPITAVADGTVYTNTYASCSGYYVVIKHPYNDGYCYSYYGHMIKKSNLKIGTLIKKGDVIGYVGRTGEATGNHLHFEWSKHDPYCLFLSHGFLKVAD